jgi:hypothetical protein
MVMLKKRKKGVVGIALAAIVRKQTEIIEVIGIGIEIEIEIGIRIEMIVQ